MAKRVSNVLGVDIGSSSIKIAEVRTQGSVPVVTALAVIPTPPGAVDHTGIFNPDAVGDALKQAIQSSGVTVQDAVFSVSGQADVMVRVLEVPRMNDEELEKHMQWEISRITPFAETTVHDYAPLADHDPSSQNMDVVLAISPMKAVTTLTQCAKKAGRKLAAIDVEPLSMARVLSTNYDDAVSGETLCLVDIGHKTSSIDVFRDGKLILPRQVPLGGESFTQAIAENLTISFDEAERVKLETAEIPEGIGKATAPVNPFFAGAPAVGAAPATAAADDFQPYNPFMDDPSAGAAPASSASTAPPPVGVDDGPPIVGAVPVTDTTGAQEPYVDPVEADIEKIQEPPMQVSTAPVPQANPEAMRIYNAMAPAVGEFLDEVRRSIDYYRSRGGSVDRILISGGGSKLKGLAGFLSDSIGLPCDSLDPLRRLNVNVRKVAPGFIDEHRQEFTIAIGNGLHIFYA